MRYRILGLALLIISPIIWAHSVIKQTDNFQTIQSQIKHVLHNSDTPGDVLIVLDDDGTISDMKFPPKDKQQPSGSVSLHGIGGVGWIHWQQKLLKQCQDHPHHANCHYLIAPSLKDLYNAQAIIFRARWADIVQPQLVKAIKQDQQEGITVIGETARPPLAAEVTQAQLHHLINDQNAGTVSLNLSANPIHVSQSGLGAQGYFNCPGLSKAPLFYQDGIMYVTGQNKGQALHCLLKKTHNKQHFNTIVFVDDLKSNVEDVANAFQNQKNISVYSYHYTADQPYKHVNKEQAHQDWQALQNTLHKSLTKHARYPINS